MINLNKNYPYQPELNNVAYRLLKRSIKRKKNQSENILILDVGCGYAQLLDKIKSEYDRVDAYGIEGSKEVCEFYRGEANLFNLDLTNYVKADEVLASFKFDAIIFSDVLEHIYDPIGVLNHYKKYLKNNGEIIITVPNIANIYSRIFLMAGSFNYGETGVMDKTHIRFFTISNLNAVVNESKLNVVDRDFDSIIVRGFVPLIKKSMAGNIVESRSYALYVKFIRPIEEIFLKISKSLFSFRIGLTVMEKL